MFRILVSATLLSLASSTAFACPAADAAAYRADLETVEAAEGERVVLTVKGMTCTSCSDKISAALMKIEGVVASAVDYQNGLANIAFDERTNAKALVAAVTATGFQASLKAN